MIRLLQAKKLKQKLEIVLPLRNIPVGFIVHNVEITPGSGGKFARSAGTSVQLVAKEDESCNLKDAIW